MELKYDFNGGEWKGNQICNLKSCWQEHCACSITTMISIKPNATFEGQFLNTEVRCNTKSASFVLVAIAFPSSVFNRENYHAEM
ncbi:hypothetical protein T10_5426 [Trichinella papuae]|uniref:Uncharacterized protein n=1 Tax=Trichinella papuae TaxID=268474 RepID=A0A0V1M0C0_9BILA|nr:hypothetical protein T10_5426 [Trichinella papuae]